MSADRENTFSFGRYLKGCRLAKGIDLFVLSDDLKISTDILQALENEDFSRIPESVYAKGFLRAFANAVDADADIVIHNYAEQMANLDTAQAAESGQEKENGRFWFKLVISVSAMLLLMTITIFTYYKTVSPDKLRSSPAVKKEPADGEDRSPSGLSSGEIRKPKTAIANTEKRSEALLLTIDTLEETWIKIIIDNQKPSEYTLQAGDYLELGAISRYNLLIGNATGVKLFLNGNPVPVPGEQGEVVTIEIP